MLSKLDSRKKIGENSGSGKLLDDIEAISKALLVDKSKLRVANSTVSSRSKSVGKSHVPDPKSKTKPANKDTMDKDKDSSKKSLWSWKGFKALTHVRDQRFNCQFSLYVHTIEGLPVAFDDLSLMVHWKRRDAESVTQPVKVSDGLVEFEEQLTHACSVYGRRNGSAAKYEAKHFLLYASVYGTPDVDLGRHQIDMTRFLPFTLEELQDEKSSGRWTTSFRLSGKAKGSIMNVSFGYRVIGDGSAGRSSSMDVSLLPNLRHKNANNLKLLDQFDQNKDLSKIRQAESLPMRSSTAHRPAEEVKDLHEILPVPQTELSKSVDMLYKKLDEENLYIAANRNHEKDVSSEPPESLKPLSCVPSNPEKEVDDDEYDLGELFIVEQGVELSSKEMAAVESDSLSVYHHVTDEHLKVNMDNDMPIINEVMPVKEDSQNHPPIAETDCDKHEVGVIDSSSKENAVSTKESIMKDLESVLNSISDLADEGLDSEDDETDTPKIDGDSDNKVSSRIFQKSRSLNLDAVTDSVTSDFLDMLGIDHSPYGLSSESEPDSPRERLLRQFEKDTLAGGYSLFNFNAEYPEAEIFYDAPRESGWTAIGDSFSEPMLQASDMANFDVEAIEIKPKVSMLEDLETEALMREYGLNEKAFQSSPPKSSGGFGSPIDVPPEVEPQLPPLGEGLGPFVQTRNGGFLRSMNPALFRNCKVGGSLIMQVSSPVVVPAEMGSGIMDILQGLASVGIEKLSMQANKLMPLEDITGKTVQQIAWEAGHDLEASDRQELLLGESELGASSFSDEKRTKIKSSGSRSSKLGSIGGGSGTDSEYVSLEDLAPLAMDNIEALSIEGLRIQSGMSEEDAPSDISPQIIGEFSGFKGRHMDLGGSLGLEGAGGLQLLDIKDNGDDIDGLMGLSLTLDEWMRLDSGEIDDDCISEHTSKILAAHHAKPGDLFHGRSKGEKRRGKGRKCGLLGNNFTVALMVQLRDPLRNYEPVGAPMLALIQVERVFVPPKPKIYSSVSEVRCSNDEEEDECNPTKEDKILEAKEEKVLEEEEIPQYKITEVHVAGLKNEPGKKKLWGSTSQQQSGSRWLLANGMGKKNKHPLLKSKANPKSSSTIPLPSTTTAQPGDTLWSISSRVHGNGAKWKELAALNPHIRNPNVLLPNETIRLR